MRFLGDLFWPIVNAAIMAACIYWASLFYRDARLQERLGLPKLARLFAVLGMATLVYTPVNWVVRGVLNILNFSALWSTLGGLLGAAVIVAMVYYLFVWLERGNPS